MIFNNNAKCVSSKYSLADPDPNVLGMFQSHQNKDQISGIMHYIVTRPVMPLIHERSPILTILLHDKEPKNKWKPRFTNSYLTILLAHMIIRCYTKIETLPFYEKNTDLCKSINEFIKKETDILEKKLSENIKSLNNTNLVGFKVLIHNHTFNYINLLETCLYKLFVKDKIEDLTLDECRTKTLNMADQKILPETIQAFEKHFTYFFNEKQKITNIAFQTLNKVHFDSKDKIYEQYMQYYTKYYNK